MKLEKNFQCLEEAFLTYDSAFISEDILVGLQNILPTPKERSEYSDLDMSADDNWTLADKYIKFACSIEAF